MRRTARTMAAAGCLVLALSVVAADSTPAIPAPDPYADLRGLLLDQADLQPQTVLVDAPVSLPTAGPAYRIHPPGTADLRALAERYAGGPVVEGGPPRFSEDLTSFATGDGWFSYHFDAMNGDTFYDPTQAWTWTDAAAREQAVRRPQDFLERPCPPKYRPATERIPAFFAALGFEATLKPPRGPCSGDRTSVGVALSVDGLPLIGARASAQVNPAGEVTAAYGPLWRLESLGQVPLAPPAEVVRRLQRGSGLLTGDCYGGCHLTTRGAVLGLGYATTGGLGSHDHTPGGIVQRPPSQVLIPALRVPAASTNPQGTHTGVIAASSAVLVDDPAQAGAAAAADLAPAEAERTPACATNANLLVVCSSRRRPAAGTPVVLTVYGERSEPVGAAGCDLLFALDAGGEAAPRSFLPRSGTLITARVVVGYDEPGTYVVTARTASRCRLPASPGGSEPEYDYAVELTITVT